MLNELTWGQYWAAAGVTLLLYYTGVALIFYRGELTRFVLSQKATGQQGRLLPVSNELQQLLTEIDSILRVADKKASKDELLAKLRQPLASFTGLRTLAETDAVLNHVLQQAAALCEVYLSEEEVEGLLQSIEGETAGK